MINISYDKQHNAIMVEFLGNVNVSEGKQYCRDISEVIPKDKTGFNLLIDMSLVKSMDLEIHGAIEKSMDLINAQGVKKIIRVIPSLEKDIGFNIMSMFHYSPTVKVITVSSRREALERLHREKNA